MNKKELEMRIWGKSIASARKNGLISEEEAHFLLDEYLKEFKAKSGWTWQKHFASLPNSGTNRGLFTRATTYPSDPQSSKQI